MKLWGNRKNFKRIGVDCLQPGMHISLAERWLDHPFLLSEFTLEDEDQIDIIRDMGMTSVLWSEAMSTAPPRNFGGAAASAAEKPAAAKSADGARVAQAKSIRDERRQRTDRARARTVNAGKAYLAASTELREVFSTMFSSPEAAAGRANRLVTDVVDAFTSNDDVSIMLLSERLSSNNMHTHAINVMLLSLMIAKPLGLNAEQLRELGLGALFHDIGLLQIPSAVRMKPEAERSSAEHNLIRTHPELGVRMVSTVPTIGTDARAVIAMHHEQWNGAGHPFKLAGEKIPLTARIATIADRYDELCNPSRLQDSVPPAEALARMYKLEGNRYDPALLTAFIKSMGIYPAGTVVELSNGSIGLVISVNRNNTLRPLVTVWQENCKPEDAPVIDLMEEPEVTIARTLNVQELTPAVREYLNPRARTAYYYAKAANG